MSHGIIEPSRQNSIRTIKSLAAEHFADYEVRHPDSATFAEYALGHVTRLYGKRLQGDIDEEAVKQYQITRLKEKASSKSINDEVGFLLRLLDDHGDIIRGRMKRKKTLKLKLGPPVGKAYSEEEKTAMLAEAKRRATLPNGSKHVYPALCIALRCGLRDKETRRLRWMDVNLFKRIITVGHQSKTEASTGRTVPMNDEVFEALIEHAKWYGKRFGEPEDEWYLFAWGSPQPLDPTKHQTSFKTVWSNIRKTCGFKGRWQDIRHTFTTDVAESPDASDSTLRSMTGHVSQRMQDHYSHTRMEAKRKAVASFKRAGSVAIDENLPK